MKFILWIDDIQTWAGIASQNLYIIAQERDINLVVMPQLNGENLEQIFMMYPFDLIVMDYHMSPFNGDTYIKQIREQEHLDAIPILFYTNDPDVNLQDLIADTRNVHITNRKTVEDRIKGFVFPPIPIVE